MKKNWAWACHYDQGSGEDRECCRAGGRKPMTEKAAKAAAVRHNNNSWHGCRPSWGYGSTNYAEAFKVDLRRWRWKAS